MADLTNLDDARAGSSNHLGSSKHRDDLACNGVLFLRRNGGADLSMALEWRTKQRKHCKIYDNSLPNFFAHRVRVVAQLAKELTIELTNSAATLASGWCMQIATPPPANDQWEKR